MLLALFLAGCGETSTPQKVEPGSAQPSKANTVKPPETFNVGDTVSMGKLRLTVNAVRYDAGGGFIKPKDGHVYLVVDATLENAGDKAENVSSVLMFKVQDADAYSYNISIGPDTKGNLDGEIGPTRKMRGEVAFEIPKTAKGLELIFEPNVFGSGQAIVRLGDAR